MSMQRIKETRDNRYCERIVVGGFHLYGSYAMGDNVVDDVRVI